MSEQLHYDAFISYRHTEVDAAVAEEVHKKIEHYRIPKTIQKTVGKKRFSRVFRDQEELPLSSDLTGSILQALENSEYLIVICSKSACESKWVLREIEYFIQRHGQERVLTILVDDEPEEAFPEILRYTDKKITDIDGNEIVIREEVEPLAADVRGNSPKERKKKLGRELLRILAPMLNCTYDDLKQRQKEYRNRRLSLIGGAALCAVLGVAGYSVRKNQQIAQANEAALLSQSKYLNTLALDQLQNKQPLQAMETALQAASVLVENENGLADTQYVLSQALNVYTLEENAYISAVTAFELQSKYYENSFFTDSEDRLLFTCTGDQITIWNLDSGQVYGTIESAGESIEIFKKELLLEEENILFFGTSSKIYAYNYKEDRVEWGRNAKRLKGLALSEKQNQLFSVQGDEFLRLDIFTGEKANLIEFAVSGYEAACSSIAISPEGNYAVFDLRDYKTEIPFDDEDSFADFYHAIAVQENLHDAILAVDLNKNTWEIMYPEVGMIDEMIFIDEKNLIAITDDSVQAEYVSHYTSWLNKNNMLRIAAVNVESQEKSWYMEKDYGTVVSDIQTLVRENGEMLVAAGNHVFRISTDNGEILQTWETGSRICYMWNLSDEGFHILCEDGKIARLEFDSEIVNSMDLLDVDIHAVIREAGCYLACYEGKNRGENAVIIQYEVVGDSNYTMISAEESDVVKEKIENQKKEQRKREEADGEIPEELAGENILSFLRMQDESIIAAVSDGTVVKYNAEMEKIWSIDLMTDYFSSPVWYRIDDSRLFLTTIHAGYEIDISDETYGLAAVVEAAVCYDVDTDRYYIGDLVLKDEITGYFPRYKMKDLIEKAESLMQM